MAKKTSAKLPAAEAAAEFPRETGRYSAPALEKGLDILEYLSERGDGSTLAQVADGIERTKGEIFRMLAVLEARGYVEREDERYRVTDKLFRVGMRRPKYRALADIATPLMRDFSEATRYPCHLAIPTGGQIVVIARAEGPDLVGVTVRIGYRQPFLVTGSGYCLLSFMSEASRLRAFEAIRAENDSVDWAALETRLAQIRKQGRVVEPSRIMDGVWDVSCPILGPDGKSAVAALTVPYVRLVINPVTPEAVGDALCETSAQISAALGAL
ncbi:MAG: IclR family transcriptional regulator [Parvibaculum sp.]|uniref:IclR family transcriptional regulator n=1 Tax=Parvibaculum sp. TaxID=2024848 RepID=UPI003C725BDE